MKVIKRDGTIVDYDRAKIVTAIGKANAEVPEAERLPQADIDAIIDGIEALKRPRMLVEDIQDLVEQAWWRATCSTWPRPISSTAITGPGAPGQHHRRVYSLPPAQREPGAGRGELQQDTMIAATQRDYIAGEVSRDLTRRILLPEKISKAHDEGAIHFHDADYFIQPIFNCCLINIGDMLDNGTVMNGKLIESPKSFQVACTVMTQIIACVASNQYGGQSVDLRHLGKYLRKSREKFKAHIAYECAGQVDEATVERLVADRLRTTEERRPDHPVPDQHPHDHQRPVPLVTLFLNLQEDDPYLEENAMIVEEVLRQRLEGIKNEKGVYITPAFPKLVYVLDEHNCLKGGKYDYITELAVKCSAKRMYPDYISAKKMRENYEGNVFSPMGCRSFLSPWKDENGNYQFEGRFNQGVVSLNLPQIGILARGDEEKFGPSWRTGSSCASRPSCAGTTPLKNVKSDSSPIHWRYGAIARLPKGAPIAPLLYGGYSSISLGYIGLYEVTKLMKGVSHTQPEGLEFAMQVMRQLRKACDD